MSVNLFLVVSNTNCAAVAPPVGRNTFITARTPNGLHISAYSPRRRNSRSLMKSEIVRARPSHSRSGSGLPFRRPAGERIVVPDVPGSRARPA